MPVGGGRVLHHPDLVMRPADRIALTGPNGGGKSTLLRALLREGLNVDDGHLVYVPQEVDVEDSRRLLDAARALPGDELGRLIGMNFIGQSVRCLARSYARRSTPTPSGTEKTKMSKAGSISFFSCHPSPTT